MIEIRTATNGEWYRKWGKRMLDVVVSGLALLLLWPVIALIAAVVRIVIGSPVLFVQPRPGLNERIFKMLKFRTMTDARHPDGELLPDELRVTQPRLIASHPPADCTRSITFSRCVCRSADMGDKRD